MAPPIPPTRPQNMATMGNQSFCAALLVSVFIPVATTTTGMIMPINPNVRAPTSAEMIAATPVFANLARRVFPIFISTGARNHERIHLCWLPRSIFSRTSHCKRAARINHRAAMALPFYA